MLNQKSIIDVCWTKVNERELNYWKNIDTIKVNPMQFVIVLKSPVWNLLWSEDEWERNQRRSLNQRSGTGCKAQRGGGKSRQSNLAEEPNTNNNRAPTATIIDWAILRLLPTSLVFFFSHFCRSVPEEISTPIGVCPSWVYCEPKAMLLGAYLPLRLHKLASILGPSHPSSNLPNRTQRQQTQPCPRSNQPNRTLVQNNPSKPKSQPNQHNYALDPTYPTKSHPKPTKPQATQPPMPSPSILQTFLLLEFCKGTNTFLRCSALSSYSNYFLRLFQETFNLNWRVDFYRTRVRSLAMLVSNWLPNWLTHWLRNV